MLLFLPNFGYIIYWTSKSEINLKVNLKLLNIFFLFFLFFFSFLTICKPSHSALNGGQFFLLRDEECSETYAKKNIFSYYIFFSQFSEKYAKINSAQLKPEPSGTAGLFL